MMNKFKRVELNQIQKALDEINAEGGKVTAATYIYGLNLNIAIFYEID